MGLAVVVSIVGPAEYVFVEAVVLAVFVVVVAVFVDVIAVFVEGLVGCVGCVPNVTKETFSYSFKQIISKVDKHVLYIVLMSLASVQIK